MLMLAPLTAQQVATWAAPFGEMLAEVAEADGVAEGMDVWSQTDGFLSDRVQNMFWHAMADWSLLAEMSGSIDVDSSGSELLIVRKLAPMAVLLPSLGWERARLLPGVAGLWLLDSEGVRSVADNVEQAFTMSATERVAVIDRMAQALLLGDQPDLDLDHLLDIVPNSFASAAKRGTGMMSCTAVVE